MTLDLKSITQSILTTVFNLGGDVVKSVSYVRPVSLARETGETAVNEISVTAQAVIGTPPQGSLPTRVSDHERLLIRAILPWAGRGERTGALGWSPVGTI